LTRQGQRARLPAEWVPRDENPGKRVQKSSLVDATISR
jgi:hypothetical protein